MKINKIFFLIWGIVFLSSCCRIDFSSIETEKPYVGRMDGRDLVVIMTHADEGDVSGKVYWYEEDCIASPVQFSSNLKKDGKGVVRMEGKELPFTVKQKNGSLSGDITTDGGAHSFTLTLAEQSDTGVFHAQYKQPQYEVVKESDRVYAKKVRGYWAIYPESRDDFLSIYVRKIKDMILSEKLDLGMDIYYPKGDDEQEFRPLLLLIHGGAFYNGSKISKGYPEMARYFASRGYVVASINYRMGFWPLSNSVDRAGYRAVQDANAAVRYLIHHADEFRIDTSKIFVAGSSAGAITALNLAFMQEENRPEASLGKAPDFVQTITRFIGLDNLLSKLGLDYDMGSINSVNSEINHPFHIKAVVNMWGAVHDLSMLNNSRETAILSFHGDADNIVPYDCDYPFRDIIDVDDLLDELPNWVANIIKEQLMEGKSINEIAFRKMYGSHAVSQKADALGIRNVLHTAQNAGHSLHVKDDGSLSDYFWKVILPETKDFLCESIVGECVKLSASSEAGRYELNGISHVKELYWKIDGGVVVNKTDNYADVRFFSDAEEHYVRVSGVYDNGVEFCERIKIKVSSES